MTKLGVVANPRSWKNRKADGAARSTAENVIYDAPTSATDYPRVLQGFAEAGVDAIAVDGGDGTLRDVMSAMIPAFGERQPAVALLPSGKTNVAAADVGGVGRGPDAIDRLAASLRAGNATRDGATRRPIEISFDGRSVYGFVFGLGAFERATRLVDDRVHAAGFAQKLGVALGVVTSGSAALFGKDREAWANGVPLSIAFDGREGASHDSFAVLATSLKRWMMGLWPFWGLGPGAIALTEVDAPPRRLAAGLATAGIGRPRPWAEKEGWRSVRADRVEIACTAPFIVDGDRFEPGADRRIALRAGPEITFIKA